MKNLKNTEAGLKKGAAYKKKRLVFKKLQNLEPLRFFYSIYNENNKY